MSSQENEICFIASDHAGLALKHKIIETLQLNFIDLGPSTEESVDYPDYAHKLCEQLIHKQQGLPEGAENGPDLNLSGILICGSGQGMAITANKYPTIRAALCWNEEIAKLSRQHNNANVLCLSARYIDMNLNLKIVKAFMETPFEGGRHQRRVEKI